MSCKNTLPADMSTAKPHGISESRGSRKVPEAAKRTRGPWPKGGNFLGQGQRGTKVTKVNAAQRSPSGAAPQGVVGSWPPKADK